MSGADSRLQVLARERGALVGTLIAVVTVVVIAVVLIFFVFGRIVPPGFVGVRQNYYGVFGLLEKGFGNRGLAPGLHWRIIGVSDVILIPSGFQLVHFNDTPLTGDLNHAVLDVPTKDGSKVKSDVTLVVRYFQQADTDVPQPPKPEPVNATDDERSVPFAVHHERPHGGPRDLILRYRAEPNEQLKRLSQEAENELRKALGVLSTTEFYRPHLRERAVLAANERINDLVNPFGVEIWGTLIRRYVYAEKTIDDQIFAKNLQDATERLNAAASERENARAKTAREAAEGTARIRDLQVQTEADIQVIRSEGIRYEQTKIAEGDLLVASAKAEVDAAKATALQELAGAEVYMAREMTPLLRSLRGGVVTAVDPYNVDAWAEKLSGGRAR